VACCSSIPVVGTSVIAHRSSLVFVTAIINHYQIAVSFSAADIHGGSKTEHLPFLGNHAVFLKSTVSPVGGVALW